VTQYRQSGVVYRASGVAYATSTTITPEEIACTAAIPTDFQFEYRQSGQAYRNSYDYRQAIISGNVYLVVATPAAVAVTTSITATAGVPVTITLGTAIAAVAAVPAPADIDANYVHVDVGIAAICAVPAPTILTGVILHPDEIAGIGGVDPITGVNIVEAVTIVGVAAVPDATLETHVTPATITVDLTSSGARQLYTFYPGAEALVPPVGLRNKPTPAAYALARHYIPRPRAGNLFIINGTSVQNYLPVDTTTVTRWLLGGHFPPSDLTSSEITLLEASGYPIDVGSGVS
jgi:hypothetical protein